MSTMSNVQPAGWYDDPTGQPRYWDGHQWTEITPPPTTKRKLLPNWYGFTAIVGGAVIVVLGLGLNLPWLSGIGTFAGVALACIGLTQKGQSKASSIVALVIWGPLAILSLVLLLLWATS